MNLRNEIIQLFRSYQIKGFQIVEHYRFGDQNSFCGNEPQKQPEPRRCPATEFYLPDSCPIAFIIQVPFHPQKNLLENLPKEICFQSFHGTCLENKPIFIKGDLVLV
jgi:hypothetical protein